MASPGAEDGQGGVSETRPERCLTAYARPRPSGLSVAPAAASHFGLFIVVEEMAWRRTGDPSPGKGGGKQPNKQIEAAVHVYARLPRVETCSRRCLVAGGRGEGGSDKKLPPSAPPEKGRKERKGEQGIILASSRAFHAQAPLGSEENLEADYFLNGSAYDSSRFHTLPPPPPARFPVRSKVGKRNYRDIKCGRKYGQEGRPRVFMMVFYNAPYPSRRLFLGFYGGNKSSRH